MQPEYLTTELTDEELISIILDERRHRSVREQALRLLRVRDNNQGYRDAMWGEDDE